MITAPLLYFLDGQAKTCEIQYEELHPFSVRFLFHQTCMEGDCNVMHEVPWEVSRDILMEGTNSEEWIGVGDFSVRRDDNDRIAVRLEQTDDPGYPTAVIFLTRRTLRNFLKRTYRIVPEGKEAAHLDWDALDAERATW